ncbi:MAG: helix-turn-helix transcriptional regulator [Puniceicoccaceae bacterium]
MHNVLHLFEIGRSGIEDVLPPPLFEAKNELEKDLTAGCPLEKLARRHGFNYPTFRRWFRDAFGCAPGQFLRARRLEAATRLLIQSRDTIQMIGERVGYDNPSISMRNFKQYNGIPPREYRDKSIR